MFRFFGIFSITLSLFTVNLYSQSKQEFGFADKAIPELQQFEYYRGVWTTKIEMVQEDGSFKMIDAVSTVKGWFLDDHKTFQSQFTVTQGSFSTDIRTFNSKANEWQALFLNATEQRWHKFTCKIVDGKMNTIVVGGYSGKEKFDVKTVDTIESNNKYQRDVFYSYDNMKTWVLIYKMYATRVE